MSMRAAIILAAGRGTRMRSSLPKVLHKVGARTMLDWSIALARQVGCEEIVCVLSPDAAETIDHVRNELGQGAIALQSPALGTGHAVNCARDKLSGFDGHIVVLYADSPLIPAANVQDLFKGLEAGQKLGVLGFETDQPAQYGRLVSDADGKIDRIVEARDATADELAISFCNSGVLAGHSTDLFSFLSDIGNENAKGEYYLTDCVAICRARGGEVFAVKGDRRHVLGVNSRAELAAAEAAFQRRRRDELMANGVTLQDPNSVYLAFDTVIEPDVTLEPSIVFGPGVRVATGSWIRAFSHLEGATIGQNTVIGPFARLRAGTQIDPEARIGNFVEVKNSHIGAGAKANHLAYIGDGEVGDGANLGAGTIFCNYDGFRKSRTQVGAGAFIGSNSALIAPVAVGQGAYVGSGSVITKNVPANALSVARARQKDIAGWASNFRFKAKQSET